MKIILMLLVIAVSTCKSVEKTAMVQHKNDLLLQYSKGPCLGICPVYDLYIYHDGTILFKGLNNLIQTGEIKSYLSPDILNDISVTLKKESTNFESTRKIRDLPVTTLKYDHHIYKYHTSRIHGKQKELNSKIEEIVIEIISERKKTDTN